ncbi:MAG: hypothetical protein DI536_34765 [Archangium gephyra]|uniref:FAD-binding PCMH-type domain-containing protein n=1 Tax=Archangium gephyra TaxID=48 RepID=A0A2W5U5S8_9BACT|nr:MAG: hypothetical protein DI536_34765 [Archangium gephyra]
MPSALRSPNLIWHPGLARDARPLRADGPISGSPFTTRGAALQAATAARKNDAVTFLIEHGPEGFTVHRYGENARTHVDGHELRFEGPQKAETWLLDATGALHKLANSRFVKSTERDFFQPAAVTGGRKLPSVPAEKQVNHGRNVTWTPRFAFRPGRDIEQLVDVMKWVQHTLPPDVKVKAVGARHAWSPAAATDGVLIHPEGLEFTEAVEGHPELLRVGSGTRVRDLNQTLWQRGQSLPVLGGFDGQTVGGVLPTGTHGSVLSRASLAEELVRSIDLVTPAGEKVRLEPSNGITDAAAFARSNPGWKLIKSDDAFNAGLINVGTFGVVHSYVLAPVPRFHMKEVRTLTTGAEAERILRGGNLTKLMQTDDTGEPTAKFPGHPDRAYHLELLWNPHSDKLVVTSRQPLPEGASEKLRGTAGDDARPSRDLFRTLTVPEEFGRPRWAVALFDELHAVVGTVNDVSNELFPSQAPKQVDRLLEMMPDPGGFIGRSYTVFNIGDGANQLPAQSATISVPIAHDQYLEAMDVLRQTAKQYAAEHGQYQTGPISLRFVKGSKALLGDPVDVCKFEIIFSGNDKADQAHAKALTAAYTKALAAKFGNDVRFHFGQLAPEGFDSKARLNATLPGFGKFQDVRRQFDPSGRMLNAWQEQMFG